MSSVSDSVLNVAQSERRQFFRLIYQCVLPGKAGNVDEARRLSDIIYNMTPRAISQWFQTMFKGPDEFLGAMSVQEAELIMKFLQKSDDYMLSTHTNQFFFICLQAVANNERRIYKLQLEEEFTFIPHGINIVIQKSTE